MRVMLWRSALIALACISVAACDKKSPETPDPGTGTPSGDTRVSPGDRLGWSQQAADATDVASYQFALYVDGIRMTLSGVSCARAASASAFDCSATLPNMSNGTHTLELASFVADGSATIESARSAPLRVVFGSTSGFSVSSQLLVTAEQVRLNLSPVAEGLVLPSDIAFGPEGRSSSRSAAESCGSFGTASSSRRRRSICPRRSGATKEGCSRLRSIRSLPTNGFMYALYAVEAPRNGLEFTLARFRFIDGTFAERAVLLDRTRASVTGPSGALRIGPDGKLYVALDSASDARIASSFATYNGKVLRFNTDATTPDDQPAANPIYSLEHPQPLAVDWQPAGGALWVIDRVGIDAGRLSAVVKEAGQSRATVRTSYALPAGTGASSAAFYRGALMPIFEGNLFVAAEMGRELVRLRFDPDNATKVVSVEHLLHDQIGAVRVVAPGPDGGLYVATESVLYRLAP